jgi:lycopene beta-cyclase
VAPLVERTWNGYRVLFPRHERDMPSPYSMVSSDRLHDVVSACIADAPGSALLTNTVAQAIRANTVDLGNGEVIRARVVIDARGPSFASLDTDKTGYQKFVGLEVKTDGPHGLDQPIIMDARVEQIDGFRFLYVLPLDANRLLLEDTRFSNTSALDVQALTAMIHRYAAEHGYRIAEILRTETGVLPLPWSGEMPRAEADEPILGGFQGGWFHPVTGYSFPIALRLASHLADCELGQMRGAGLQNLIREQQRQLAFGYRLNKMLFTWFAPGERYNVLERFYTLPESIIRRFYAQQTTSMDRARILIGRPPRGMSYKAAVFGRRVS